MAVASTGFFDGVHLGHRKVVEKMHSIAVSMCTDAIAVTFWPHPRAVLCPATPVGLLSTLDEKKSLLAASGADRVEVLPFSREFSLLTAREFVSSYLRDGLGVDTLVVGYDHRIGHDSFDALEDMMAVVSSCGVRPVSVGQYSTSSGPASSSAIRSHLLAGDIVSANSLLGYPYTVSGFLVSGTLHGVDPVKLVPADGSYLVSVLGSEMNCEIRDGVVFLADGVEGRVSLNFVR